MKKKPTKPTKVTGKKPARKDDYPIHFMVGEAVYRALEGYLNSLPLDGRPSKKAVMVTALYDYLASKGHWPPKVDAEAGR